MVAQVKIHNLEPVNTSGSKYKYRCTVCLDEWVTRPKSTCPGVRVFFSRNPPACPAQYKTLKELEEKGLRPKNSLQPNAVFRPSRHRREFVPLYDETKAIRKSAADAITKIGRNSLRLWAWFLNLVVTGVLSILLGLNTAPSSFTTIPLLTFLLHNQLVSLIFLCGVVLITLIGVLHFLWVNPLNRGGLFGGIFHSWNPLTSTSITSFFLCFILLMIVLIRPSWCPTSLCPAPKILIQTNPQGVHDNFMELYFQTLQSSSFVIPSAPAHYKLSTLPESIGAVLVGGSISPLPYRVIVNVHSLQQGHFGIRIMRVDLLLLEVPSIPSPLNIWMPGSQRDYHSNPYRSVYNGQRAGEILPASYTIAPDGYVQLAPSEVDTLDIQVASYVPVALKFQVQVTYRVTNEPLLRTLTLPTNFEVIFSTRSNWHPYRFTNGHFTVAIP